MRLFLILIFSGVGAEGADFENRVQPLPSVPEKIFHIFRIYFSTCSTTFNIEIKLKIKYLLSYFVSKLGVP